MGNLASCTSGAISREKACVHHVYMARGRRATAIVRRLKSASGPLRWRKTRIRDWRKAADMTQQELADALDQIGIALDRVSIARIESGEQMPLVETIEAM